MIHDKDAYDLITHREIMKLQEQECQRLSLGHLCSTPPWIMQMLSYHHTNHHEEVEVDGLLPTRLPSAKTTSFIFHCFALSHCCYLCCCAYVRRDRDTGAGRRPLAHWCLGPPPPLALAVRPMTYGLSRARLVDCHAIASLPDVL